MRYTLITPTGQVLVFFVQALAEIYRQGLGGVVITADVLIDTTVSI